jgi:hypothetical protein
VCSLLKCTLEFVGLGCSQLGASAGLQTTRLCKMSVDSVIGELFNDAVATECRQGRAGLVILACTLQFECLTGRVMTAKRRSAALWEWSALLPSKVMLLVGMGRFGSS